MIIDYINQNQAEFWIAAGFVLLSIELLILALGSGILLFAGLGSLLTGIIMMLGFIPETWMAGISSMGISSGVITVLLWAPLRKLQGGKVAPKDTSSDFIGLEFVLDKPLSRTLPVSVRYSGVNWKLELHRDVEDEIVEAGQAVVVASVDVGVFRVKPKLENKDSE